MFVHLAGIGGGTTCPYEQLTPTSPSCHEVLKPTQQVPVFDFQKVFDNTLLNCDLLSSIKGT